MHRAIERLQKRALFLCSFGILIALGAPISCGGNDSVNGGQSHGGSGGAGEAGEGGQPDNAPDAGDAGGTGGSGGGDCASASFVNPADGAQLTEADDAQGAAGAGGDSCSDGFQYDIKVSTSAADGTPATLFAGSNKLATSTVAGGVVIFAGTTLSIGADTLQVQVGDEACLSPKIRVTVACNGIPSCDVSKPVVSATHPELNGVPVAQGGDRASAAGSPYQVAFEVTTSVEDGQPVSLQINSSSELTTVLAKGGKAEFAGVPLSPDGDFTVVASCQAQSGKSSKSAQATFTVDTTPPNLTVTEPVAGKHFGPTDDSDPATAGQQFQVCATTDSLDALNLPAALGSAQNNFCVAMGTATPVCVPVTGATSAAPCVTLSCQDRAPFDLNVTLGDGAGNSAQATVQGVSCSSTLPAVAIVDPVDGTGSDLTTHILAASTTNPRKDEDPAAAGAQFTVRACTDVPNGSMTLLGSVKGDAPQTLATTTAVSAVASDNCPAGKAYVGRFTKAKLPESEEEVLGALVNPTELTVSVSDQGTIGTSPAVDVWVDSVAPSINSLSPSPLCGALIQSTTPVTKSVTLFTGAVPVAATVTNGGTVTNYSAATAPIGHADLGPVAFGLGANEVVATTVDPAGNPGALQSPCTVTVGNPPVMSWISPSVSTLNISNDSDPATPGWQGTLSVQTDLGGTGATVQFSTGAGDLGSPIVVDASGKATTPVITIPDSGSVTLTATTSAAGARGVGTISLTVVVDTVAPPAIAGLTATVPAALRRQTTFHLAWTAPDDNGAVSTYDVRVSKGTPITAGNFAAQEHVPYAGQAAAPGAADGVDVPGRLIENNYYFAVAAIDKGGNRGPVASAGPSAAHFNSTILSTGVAGEMFGYTTDGSTSLNGDAYSDLIVGAYNSRTVYIYMGSPTGYAATPSVKIIGTSSGFGRMATIVGDIDSDGLPDLAIGSPLESGTGNVYIFKGRQAWPGSIQQTDADYVIAAGSEFSGSLNSLMVTGVGDFNNDGVDDIAIGAPLFSANLGRVSIVYGVPKGTPFGPGSPPTVSLPADYGSRALQISGSGNQFGSSFAPLGRFYANGGTTLVVGAPASAGGAFAYHGLGTVGPITAPDQSFPGVAGARTGVALAVLGSGGSLPLLGIGSPAYTNAAPAGVVDIFGGNPGVGPFTGIHAVYTDSRATSVGDGFGAMIEGGVFPSGVTTSFIGDSAPDVVVAALTEGAAATHVYVLSAQNAITAGTRDIVSAADASYQMPAGWVGCSPYSHAIKDLNGDSFGDIAIGEWRRTTGFSGRVLVLW